MRSRLLESFQLSDFRAMSAQLAHALERYGRCECKSTKAWPWKQDYVCGRCRVLDEYALAKAQAEIVQRPRCSHEYAREAGKCVGCGAVL